MRKVVDWTCEDGGETRHFRIKKMGAIQSERFSLKLAAMLGAAKNKNVDLSDVMSVFAILGAVDFEKVQDLMAELLTCCSIVKENVEVKLTEENVDGFIDERNTLIQLRVEAFKVNDFFQTRGLSVFEQSPAPVDIKRKG